MVRSCDLVVTLGKLGENEKGKKRGEEPSTQKDHNESEQFLYAQYEY
jgi:hypothetical protein